MRRLTEFELEAACRASWAVARFHIASKLPCGDPGPWDEQTAHVREVTQLELRAAFAAVEQHRLALAEQEKGRG